jgi:hypothetical protein
MRPNDFALLQRRRILDFEKHCRARLDIHPTLKGGDMSVRGSSMLMSRNVRVYVWPKRAEMLEFLDTPAFMSSHARINVHRCRIVDVRG